MEIRFVLGVKNETLRMVDILSSLLTTLFDQNRGEFLFKIRKQYLKN